MRIALVLHGRNAYPPKGHGAIEILVQDLETRFRARGHEVEVVNLRHRRAILHLIRRGLTGRRPDVIWCHYQRLVPALVRWRALVGRVVVATSHAPITDWRMPNEDQARKARQTAAAPYHLCLHPDFALVTRMMNATCEIEMMRNGADVHGIEWRPGGNGRALCLGRVGRRKRQARVARLLGDAGVPIDFAGPESTVPEDARVAHLPSYRGNWTRAEVRSRLTDYSALVLWSASEVQPLVVVEALAAGLDVVVSPEASMNLDLDLPFVHVVRHEGDLAPTVARAIAGNAARRAEIRAHAEAVWDWGPIADGCLAAFARWREGRPVESAVADDDL